MRGVRFLLLVPLLLHAAEPDTARQDAFLRRLRIYGERYARALQDFTCTRTISRSVDTSGTGAHWKSLENEEQEIDYVSHRESARTLTVDGRPVAPGKHHRGPYTSVSGEFSRLASVFSPKTSVELSWDHSEGPVCIASYHAALSSGAALRWQKGRTRDLVAHHGLLYADCETGTVSRYVLETDDNPGKPRRLRTETNYAPVSIAGREFFLPLNAESEARYGKVVTLVQVRFSGYRKYDAQTAIHFESGEPAAP